jgi:hypothetical protein
LIFQSTLPADAADLMKVSAFQRYLERASPDSETGVASTRLAALNPTLTMDLARFEQNDSKLPGMEVLEVVAAVVRHGRPLRLHLQLATRVLPLTMFPAARQMHCPWSLAQLLQANLPAIRVLHVEPALLQPLDELPKAGAAPAPHTDSTQAQRGDNGKPECHFGPLNPLLWELALRGSREALLPEISGAAAYRVVPSADLDELRLTGTLASAVQRLRRETTHLREIASWPGFDVERAMRLLNALYLQAALISSRTHPAATNVGWVHGQT